MSTPAGIFELLKEINDVDSDSEMGSEANSLRELQTQPSELQNKTCRQN